MKPMANLQNLRIISVFFLGLWCAAASAWGEPIIVQVTGVVNSVDFPNDSIQVGSSMVGFCSYDTETPDEDSSDYRGTYALNHLAMAIGDYTFSRNSASSEPALFDVWKTDMAYRAQCFYGIATESGLPLSFYHVNIKLLDLCNASVGGPDDLLPVTFPDISFFTWRNKFEVTFSQSGTGYQIQGELTSIEVVSEPSLPRVIYVDDDAPPGGDGLSWPTAYKYLQDALETAAAGDEIRVAAGTYYPSVEVGGTGDRYRTFQLINGVAIYGGFPTGGSTFANRDPNQYETTLSGDLNGNDGPNFANNSDNCYHVVTGTNTNETAILDGFTITAGNHKLNKPYPNDDESFGWGGGMYNYEGSPTVTSCTFSSNIAEDGGGMYNNEHSNPIVLNCTFIGNLSKNAAGGGMCNREYSSPTVTGCTFSSNIAKDGDGGGMCNLLYSSPEVTDCTFIGNSCDNGGGGMKNSNGCIATLRNCTFSGNHSDEYGGGVSNFANDSILIDCIFSENSAEDCGGGMGNRHGSSPTLTNCTFSENSAIEGGGVHSEESSLSLTNCTFISNSSGDSGGGMRNEYVSNLQLTGCVFTGNSAEDEGGGLSNNVTVSTIIDCTFIGNSAPGGGGLNLDNEIGSTLTNCIFSGNRAEDGGGIWGEDENVTMTNCTFSGNSADNGGGGICMDENIQLTNCIFWGNVAHGSMDESAQIWMRNSVSTIINYSCIQGWTGGWEGEGNFDVDPLFIDADGLDDIAGTEDDNLRLLPWSPCIDAGDNSVIEPNSTDLDGNPRIINGIVDMGAYEAPASIEADVHIVPRVINRNNHLKRVMAIMRLPEGVGRHDIADEPFELYAANLDGEPIQAIWQRVIGCRRRASVFALFDKTELMDLVSGNGPVELTVTGKLKSGQYIYGSDTVRIVPPHRRRPRWGHGRRGR